MTQEEIRALADECESDAKCADVGHLSLFEAAEALRAYAALLEEREAEEKLLSQGRQLFYEAGYVWTHRKMRARDKDRSEAARLALEALK